MSFLPYAKSSSGVWAASMTGSTALHGGLLALLLTSSVALLPAAIHNESRAPDFEITLEILDANIIDEPDLGPEDQLVPPDAVPLVPDDTVANLLEETSETTLTPENEIDSGLAPLDQDLTTLQSDTSDLLQPDATNQTEPENPEPVDALTELAAVAPDAAQPLAPLEIPAPDVLSIDDISPIDNSEISPLAELVAPSVIAQPDVVTLTPDAPPDELITALILPEEIAPPADTPEVLLPSVLPPEDGPEAEVVEPAVAAPDEAQAQDPPAVAANADADTTTDPDIDATTDTDTDTDTDATADPNTTPDGDAPKVVVNPDLTTAMIGTLIQRIRATPTAQCTLALPRRTGPDGVGVSFIGGQEAGLDVFAARLLEGLAPVPVQTREIIDQRQCALLDAVRQVADYPAGRIGLALDDTTLRSGENLRGRVVGAGGLFVTLLLIDDNGVVQDLSRFTTIEGNDPVFDAPVARAGPTRATRQIILALGSDAQPIDVSGQIGQEAQAVFSALPSDVLETAVFGLATFDVR